MDAEDDRIHVSVRIRAQVNKTYRKALEQDEQFVRIPCGRTHKTYSFDDVFDENCSQVFVFTRVAERIVKGCLSGYNGTIFAYGQTGSGKTYTMHGVDIDDTQFAENKGVIPRAVEYFFESLQEKQSQLQDQENTTFIFQIKCQFVELYNEQLIDLLDSQRKPRVQTTLRGNELIDAARESCGSVDDVIALLQRGCAERHSAETKMNMRSSRSHSIFIVQLETEERNGSTVKRLSSQLNLVDLAGSERISQTSAEGDRAKEAKHINQSLTTLGRVIRALAEKQQHVPCRDSILTHLLSDSLGGNSRTSFVVNVHSDIRQLEQTTTSLQFAQTLRTIKNKAHINEKLQCVNVEAYEREIARLKEQALKANDGYETIQERYEKLTTNIETLTAKQKEDAVVIENHQNCISKYVCREQELKQKVEDLQEKPWTLDSVLPNFDKYADKSLTLLKAKVHELQGTESISQVALTQRREYVESCLDVIAVPTTLSRKKDRRRTNVFSTARGPRGGNAETSKRRVTVLFDSPTRYAAEDCDEAKARRAPLYDSPTRFLDRTASADKENVPAAKTPRLRRNSEQSVEAVGELMLLRQELEKKIEEEAIIHAEMDRIQAEAKHLDAARTAEFEKREQAATNKIAECHARIETITNESRELQNRLEAAETSTKDVNKRFALLEKRLKLAQQEVDRQTNKSSQLDISTRNQRALLISREAEINDLKTKIDEQEAVITQIRAEGQSEIERTVKELAANKHTLNKYISDHEALKNRALLESGHQNQRQKIALHEKWRDEMHSLRDQAAEDKFTITEQQKKIRALEQDVSRLKRQQVPKP